MSGGEDFVEEEVEAEDAVPATDGTIITRRHALRPDLVFKSQIAAKSVFHVRKSTRIVPPVM